MFSCSLFAGLLGLGCAGPARSLSLSSKDDVKAEDYEEVLERWTRSDRLYVMLESKLFVHATFHSPEFRKAFLLRHKEVYGRGSEEARRLSLTTPEADEALEFFVSAYTANPKWNDFERDDSIWRVTLTAESGEAVDGRVVRLKTNANLRTIYPFISDFARTYAVRFPISTEAGHPVITGKTARFVLRFVSAIGEVLLEWKLDPVDVSSDSIQTMSLRRRIVSDGSSFASEG